MKNFVSFNLKTYKKSDAKAIILHSHNLKARNKSTNIKFPQYTKYNIRSGGDVWSKYQQLTQKIEEIKGKKIQKNANHFLEGVLAFSFDKFKDDPKKFRTEAPALIEEYMNRLCEKYGFCSLNSYSLHFDEGHENSDSKDLNVHAHIQMINFDFKTKTAPFRKYQQKFVKHRKAPNQHFVAMQDLANEVFKPLGFVRGVSKENTHKKHLSKEDFVTQKLQEQEKRLDAVTDELKVIQKQKSLADIKLLHVQEQTGIEERRLESIKRSLTTLLNDFKTVLGRFVKNVQKRRFNKFYDDVADVQGVIDKTVTQSQALSDDMVDTGNEIANNLEAGKPFTKKKNRPT